MTETTNYKGISFESSISNNEYLCNSYIESTSICTAVSNETSLNSLVCGEYVEADNVDGIYNHTFAALTDNNCSYGWTLTAANGPTDISNNEVCNCGNYDDNLVEYSYIRPCSNENNSPEWGGFDLTTTTTETQCETGISQELSITCSADTCDTADACLFDFKRLIDEGADNCDKGQTRPYYSRGIVSSLAICLLTHYNTLTECCQEGIKASYIENEEFTCNAVGSIASSGPQSQICAIRETCDNECNELCYENINGNCGKALSSKHCINEWNDNNSTQLLECLEDLTNSISTQCCDNNYLENAYDRDCPIAQPYFYSTSTNSYDYSLCTQKQINDTGCYNEDSSTPDLLLCLIDNKDLIQTDTCCYDFVDQSEPKFILTHDCQGDALSFGYESAWDLTNEDLAALGKFIWDNDNTPSQLSYACSESLQYCHNDGTFPTTMEGDTAIISCPYGYTGNRTRECKTLQVTSSDTIVAWGEPDESECKQIYCPEFTDEAGQLFNKTEVGKVRFYFGDFRTVTDDVLFDKCLQLSFALGYTQRYCYLNESNLPEWGDAQKACKGFYTQWDETDEIKGAYCDNTIETSLIRTYNAYEDYTQQTARIEACQDECLLFSTNCLGYLYYPEEGYCDLYDMCDLKEYTDNELNNLGYNETTQPVFTYNTLTLDQYAATVCTETAGAAANLKAYEAWSRSGIPVAECFSSTLYVYFVNPTGGTLYRDKILFNDISYLYDDESYRFADLAIESSYNSFAVRDIDDDTVAVDLILDVRDLLKKWKKDKIHVIPGGLLFDLFSQYVGVEESLVLNLLFVSIAVVITGFTFLLNWWAVVIMLLCNAAMIIEVYGFVEWLGLRVNGVLVLNIVIAVGLTMEFTAHIGRAFVLTKATKSDHEHGIGLPFSTNGQIRMKKMYREMFNPVTMGAITTFLGVLPISLAEFPYFRQYYFVLYVVIVLFGWLNGVIFQPIFLSLLPPEPFDESDILDEHDKEKEEPLNQSNNDEEAGAVIQSNDGDGDKDTNTTGTSNDDQKTGE